MYNLKIAIRKVIERIVFYTLYDYEGYDCIGYDWDGYDRDGYDWDGYARDGYNREGYSREGYDRRGYDRKGYDHDGYDRNGYDRDGYDRKGYDHKGYDREGRNQYGDDHDGYDRYGYDCYNYDRKGYDRKGYDREGYDRKGYDRKGYNHDGYDRNGYDRRGRDRKGYDHDGRDQEGFDRYGRDKDGYDRQGFSKAGIHKVTKTFFDENGYTVAGLDSNGVSADGQLDPDVAIAIKIITGEFVPLDDAAKENGLSREQLTETIKSAVKKCPNLRSGYVNYRAKMRRLMINKEVSKVDSADDLKLFWQRHPKLDIASSVFTGESILLLLNVLSGTKDIKLIIRSSTKENANALAIDNLNQIIRKVVGKEEVKIIYRLVELLKLYEAV